MAPPIPPKHSSLRRKTWSPEEDSILIDYITTHGEGHWASLPVKAGLKCRGKSCRLRWFNYLRPSIKRGNFSADEEELIIRLHRLLGNRWSLIAKRLPGRTDNDVKNFWNSHLCKKRRGNNNAIPTLSPFHNIGESTDYYWNTVIDKKVQETNDSANGENVTKSEPCEKGNNSETALNSCEANGSKKSMEEESREAVQHLQSQEWLSIYSPFPCAEFSEHDPLLMEADSDINNLSYPESISPLLSTEFYDFWGSL